MFANRLDEFVASFNGEESTKIDYANYERVADKIFSSLFSIKLYCFDVMKFLKNQRPFHLYYSFIHSFLLKV